MSFPISVRPPGGMIAKLLSSSIKRKARKALYEGASAAPTDDVRVRSVWAERSTYVPERPQRFFSLLSPYLR